MTSENYFGSMGFAGTAKNRSLELDVFSFEEEAEYPSSMLDPNKQQSISRHFETSRFSSLEHDWPLSPTQLNDWSLSNLYSNQRIGSAEAIAERVVNSLQGIPTRKRVQVYVSLLGKLEEKVHGYGTQKPVGMESSFLIESASEWIKTDEEDSENGYVAGISASEEPQERKLYENANATVWSSMFRKWVAGHRKLPYEADDSREAIYGDRGK